MNSSFFMRVCGMMTTMTMILIRMLVDDDGADNDDYADDTDDVDDDDDDVEDNSDDDHDGDLYDVRSMLIMLLMVRMNVFFHLYL